MHTAIQIATDKLLSLREHTSIVYTVARVFVFIVVGLVEH